MQNRAVSYTHLDVYKRQGLDCVQRQEGGGALQNIVVENEAAAKAGIELNRKMLSEMAINDPKSFAALVETVKNA